MNIKDKFPDFTPGKGLMEAAVNSNILSIRVDKEKKLLELDVEFDSLHSKRKIIFPMEIGLAKAYKLTGATIHPKYKKELFEPDYLNEILDDLKRKNIISDIFVSEVVYDSATNNVVVRASFGFAGADFVRKTDISRVIEDIIYKEFGFNIGVVVDDGSDMDPEYEESILREREVKYKEIYETTAAAFVEKKPFIGDQPKEYMKDDRGYHYVGNMVFDTSSAKIIWGKSFDFTPTPAGFVCKPFSNIVVMGQICAFEMRETRNHGKIYTFTVTDDEGAVLCKITGVNNEDVDNLNNGFCVAIHGKVERDEKDINRELTLFPQDIAIIKRVYREDTYPGKKRVELHLHTIMSAMDAVLTPTQAVETALRWGHTAVAITDHGVVQGYPEAMHAAEKKDIKILYGMEGYLVEENRAVFGKKNQSLNDEFVIFDIETTGLIPTKDKIIQIGAEIIKNNEVVSTFQTMADPEMQIPEFITNLTGITDEDVKGAPSQKEAIQKFLEYAGDRVLVAHNAGFDTSFIRVGAQNNGLAFDNTYIDTLAISRFVNPTLKKHKLNNLSEYYKLGDFDHHRADADTEMLRHIFTKMVSGLVNEGINTISDLESAMAKSSDSSKVKPYHVSLLVKDKVGLKNLYKLVSYGYIEYFNRVPRIPKLVLQTHKEGLIIGSACERGEIFQAIYSGKSWDEIKSIAELYDYLEIMPVSNNRFYVRNGSMSEEDLRNINRQIVKLGEEMNIPVVATGDVHYLNPWDSVCRRVLQRGMKYSELEEDEELYFKTTDEMMKEFSYLGEKKAYEVVVENTNKIADSISGDIKPYPDGTFTPKMEGAEDDLHNICYQTAESIYGNPLPEIVKTRLDKELDSIIGNGFAVLYMIARKLVKYSESQGYLVGSRGSVGSSFVASMAGITEVNPLPPHYVCPNCKHSDFSVQNEVGSGFDLPEKNCPICGTPYNSDGHDIPFETFLGFYGDKSPDIDLNFSGEVQTKVHKYTEELFGKENVFHAGTIMDIASKTAFGFVNGYCEDLKLNYSKPVINLLVSKITGVKRTTGQHPGGIVVVPKEYEVYDFCPVQYPADKTDAKAITTHFTFNDMHDLLLKLDELGHDVPTKLKYIEEYTGTDISKVSMRDPLVYKLFTSTEPLGVKPEDIMFDIGTLGIPESGTNFVMPVMVETKPKCFADLVQISGLTHGTNVWNDNADKLIRDGTCDISTVIGTRDSIMLSLIKYGLEKKDAFDIMEKVRKNKAGKPLPDDMLIKMADKNVPEWYVESLKKIRYMFPKAHAAAYVTNAIRLAWYKVHMPLEFYCAYFTAAPAGFDAELAMSGRKNIMSVIESLNEKGNDRSQNDNNTRSAMMLVNEMLARKIEILPVDIEKSDSRKYLPENGKMRLPFSSFSGIGEAAANKIVEEREKAPFYSIEDLKERTGLSKTAIELLKAHHALDKLSETNQISLSFDFDNVSYKQTKHLVDANLSQNTKELPSFLDENEDEDSVIEENQLSFF
ncbi:MAG: PolC-type DNA polymerase III [Clostridiales bacterium]|nr:PolC-type DNA polymerase III [Clostridiales bacterium]